MVAYIAPAEVVAQDVHQVRSWRLGAAREEHGGKQRQHTLVPVWFHPRCLPTDVRRLRSVRARPEAHAPLLRRRASVAALARSIQFMQIHTEFLYDPPQGRRACEGA